MRLGEAPLLKRIAVSSGATRLSFAGALRLDDMTGSGNAELGLPDAAVLEPLVGAGLHGKLTGTGTIQVSAQGQDAKLLLNAEGLGADQYELASATLDATAERGLGAQPARIQATLKGSGLTQRQPDRTDSWPRT